MPKGDFATACGKDAVSPWRPDKLVFENRSNEVLYRLKLDDSLKPLMVLEELVW